jgi:prolyl-tRNA editing enzyme YbaK/EbsC (Cys-tRNA(Pro) deacylase)
VSAGLTEGPSSASARRVQAALDAFGRGHRVMEFAQSTRTAADAAAAVGCTVAQIAKSLVFRTEPGDAPVLVVASGTNRVDAAGLAARAADRLGGSSLARADADFVRAKTGFAIGGVPPLAHATAPVALIDEDLTAFAEIWAAAGTPNAVFRLTPAELAEMTGGRVLRVA